VDDLLTTKQLQELLQVDRVTIYRMLNDGRLQGFKVGGQWRFSRRDIDTWLQEQQSKTKGISAPPPADVTLEPTSQVLPLSCVQAMQDVCAEALDIAMVTVDLQGFPLTSISNSSDFCKLILSTEKGRQRCAATWRQIGNGQPHTCHAGLLCISAAIEVNSQTVAITVGCQFIAASAEGVEGRWQTQLPDLAADLGLPEGELEAAAVSVRVVPTDDLSRISQLIHRIADTFSEFGQERLNLISRLQHIAEVSRI
jgi:excisionase family DNA binding protein